MGKSKTTTVTIEATGKDEEARGQAIEHAVDQITRGVTSGKVEATMRNNGPASVSWSAKTR